MEGTVARFGERTRVTANLIQVLPEKHLWAQAYERNLRDVLALQSDLAESIAHEVQAKFVAPSGTRARQVNPKAYQEYILGRHLFEGFTVGGVPRAVAHLNQAISLDPDFALAQATLAKALTNRSAGAGSTLVIMTRRSRKS